jgi:hypothetical protein
MSQTTAAAGGNNSLLDVTPMHTSSYARALASDLIRIMNLPLSFSERRRLMT